MLTDTQKKILVDLSRLAEPREACGLVAVDGTVVQLQNVSATPEKAYAVDPAEVIHAYQRHGEFLGVWHSHPGGRTEPSSTDRETHPPGLIMWIVAGGEVYEHHGYPSAT